MKNVHYPEGSISIPTMKPKAIKQLALLVHPKHDKNRLHFGNQFHFLNEIMNEKRNKSNQQQQQMEQPLFFLLLCQLLVCLSAQPRQTVVNHGGEMMGPFLPFRKNTASRESWKNVKQAENIIITKKKRTHLISSPIACWLKT